MVIYVDNLREIGSLKRQLFAWAEYTCHFWEENGDCRTPQNHPTPNEIKEEQSGFWTTPTPTTPTPNPAERTLSPTTRNPPPWTSSQPATSTMRARITFLKRRSTTKASWTGVKVRHDISERSPAVGMYLKKWPFPLKCRSTVGTSDKRKAIKTH